MIDKKELALIKKNACEQALKYTMPLFFKNKKKEAEFASSSLLFTHENRFFLITATHTVERYKENLYFYHKDEIMPHLNGEWTILLRKGAATYADSNIEGAILEISKENAEKIRENFDFMTIENIATNHKINPNNLYFIAGLPSSKTKLKYNTVEIKGKPLMYFNKTNFSQEIFDKLKIEKHSHIIMDYEQKSILDDENNTITGPSPEGCSGCGLWHISNENYILERKIIPKLSGLFIEFHEKGINTLVSMRIHIILEILRTEYNLNLHFTNYTTLVI